MRRLLIGALVWLAISAVIPSSPVASTNGKPTAMLIHGGAFVERLELATSTRELRRLGYVVFPIRYPLGNVRQAYRAAAEQARRLGRRGPVVAVGESAGGTIASWLAARQRVEAAISVGAPQDFRTWQPSPTWGAEVRLPTEALRWRYSPARIYCERTAAPLYAFHYTEDPFVGVDQSRGLRQLGAHVRIIRGVGHIRPVNGAPRWLDVGGRFILRKLVL